MSESRSRSRSRKSTKHASSKSDRASSAESDTASKHHSDRSDHKAHSPSKEAAPLDVRLGQTLNKLDCKKCGCPFNGSYVFTFPGIMQCVCLFLELIGFTCMQLSENNETFIAIFYCMIAGINMFFLAMVLLLHLFNVHALCEDFAWISVEFYFYVTAAVLTLLTSSLITARHIVLHTVAAIFGYAAMLGHGLSAFLAARRLEKRAKPDEYLSDNSSRSSSGEDLP